jgi:hypothetical protein
METVQESTTQVTGFESSPKGSVIIVAGVLLVKLTVLPEFSGWVLF